MAWHILWVHGRVLDGQKGRPAKMTSNDHSCAVHMISAISIITVR